MQSGRANWSGLLSVLAGAGGIAAVAVLDFVTGPDLGFFLIYFIPISIAAWFGRRGAGLSVSVLSTVVWWYVDWLGGREGDVTLMQTWNALIRFGAFVVVVALIGAVRRLNATLEEKVAERTERVRQLASEVTSAEARERDRVARLLHDDLQQQLHAIQFQLARLRDDARKPYPSSTLETQIEEMGASLRQASSTTRSLSAELSPAALHHEDFAFGIRWLAERFRDQHGLSVEVDVTKEIAVPDVGLRLLLFSLVRECLFNVVKHAGVGEARVTLRHVGRRIVIEVEDQGRGLDASTLDCDARFSTGLGLDGAAERLELLGGTLCIDSDPERGGTRIKMCVPGPA